MSFEEDAEQPSRADALIEEVKADVRPGQFRLTGLFGLILMCAALLALPRIMGRSYGDFFVLLYFLLYGCAPLAVWAAAWLVPRRLRFVRLAVVGLVAAAIVLPTWVLAASESPAVDVAQNLFVVLLFIWLPQALCIALVQFGLFRGAIKGGNNEKRERD